jgi:hypothetical protein
VLRKALQGYNLKPKHPNDYIEQRVTQQGNQITLDANSPDLIPAQECFYASFAFHCGGNQ